MGENVSHEPEVEREENVCLCRVGDVMQTTVQIYYILFTSLYLGFQVKVVSTLVTLAVNPQIHFSFFGSIQNFEHGILKVITSVEASHPLKFQTF